MSIQLKISYQGLLLKITESKTVILINLNNKKNKITKKYKSLVKISEFKLLKLNLKLKK